MRTSCIRTFHRSALRTGAAVALATVIVALPAHAQSGRLREAIAQRRAARQPSADGGLDDGSTERGAPVIPADVRVVRDVRYGADPKQRFDAYVPRNAPDAPAIVIVHGGGWRTGDKAGKGVVENKVAHWSRDGIIVVSVNYRLLPNADPVEQARDVARALAAVQARLREWGGDPAKVVLMGHSAGAHLVALLDAHPELATSLGAHPWLGTVILDSAVLDVVHAMQLPHLPLYDHAFGTDRQFWREASPIEYLSAGDSPMLIVCSSQRRDSCPAAREFAAKAKVVHVRAEVVPEAKSHREINVELGADRDYTAIVDAFLSSLDPALRVAQR